MIKTIGKVVLIAVGVAVGMTLHDLTQPYIEEMVYGDVDMSDLFDEVDDEEDQPEEKSPIDYDIVSEEKETEEAPAVEEKEEK